MVPETCNGSRSGRAPVGAPSRVGRPWGRLPLSPRASRWQAVQEPVAPPRPVHRGTGHTVAAHARLVLRQIRHAPQLHAMILCLMDDRLCWTLPFIGKPLQYDGRETGLSRSLFQQIGGGE
jgi:hypothetical protein